MPLAISWSDIEADTVPLGIQIGEATLEAHEMRAALLGMRTSFQTWGAATLLWHLLDGGMGAATIHHHRFADESAEARAQADALVARLRDGESFYALLQETGSDAEPLLKQPSPFGLGAGPSARVAELEPGAWSGPVRSLDGWEILLLEERADGPRSRAGVLVRRMVLPVGSEADREASRVAWAKLPLRADSAVLRSLPRFFVRDRGTATSPTE